MFFIVYAVIQNNQGMLTEKAKHYLLRCKKSNVVNVLLAITITIFGNFSIK